MYKQAHGDHLVYFIKSTEFLKYSIFN